MLCIIRSDLMTNYNKYTICFNNSELIFFTFTLIFNNKINIDLLNGTTIPLFINLVNYEPLKLYHFEYGAHLRLC